MAVSSIGNLTYINQNLQVGTNLQANAQHRMDLANLTNMQDFQEKLEENKEVRKLEENEAVHPDRNSRHQAGGQQEGKHQEEQSQMHSSQEENATSDHLLDIKA